MEDSSIVGIQAMANEAADILARCENESKVAA
jgi:hypothetical protein